MTSSPPTLTGFNNNVRYRGMRFHIQTEDSGITRPHITTQLFADGGYVIKSLRTDYAEYVGHPERAALVQRLMREQHRAMALELRDGKLDATIDRIAPPPAAAAADEAPPNGLASSAPASSAPSPAPSDSSNVSSSAPHAGPSAAERTSVTVKSGTLVTSRSEGPVGLRAAPLADAEPRDSLSSDASVVAPTRTAGDAETAPTAAASSSRRPQSSRAPSSPTPSSRAPSSRKPQSSARPSSERSGAAQSSSSARAPGSKTAAPRHRVIFVGEAPPSSNTTPSADAANRVATPRRSSGSRSSGSHAAATQRPPSTQKSSNGRASAQPPPSSRGAASQRPPSSRKPARAPSRPKFTAAALTPGDKPTATTRSAKSGANARPPSSRAASSSSKRPSANPGNPPAPSSRRAGRPSPVLTPPKGSKSIFGPLPQESLDDAILNFAATVKNGPPTRGSK